MGRKRLAVARSFSGRTDHSFTDRRIARRRARESSEWQDVTAASPSKLRSQGADDVLLAAALAPHRLWGVIAAPLAVALATGDPRPAPVTACALTVLLSTLSLRTVRRRRRPVAWALATACATLLCVAPYADPASGSPSWLLVGLLASAPALIDLGESGDPSPGWWPRAVVAATWSASAIVTHRGDAGAWTLAVTGAVAVLWLPDLGAAARRTAATMITQSHEQGGVQVREAQLDLVQRQRLLLHDHASLLSMLGRDLPPELLDVARRQARAAASDVRRFVTSGIAIPPSSTSLRGIVEAVAADFGDLPIEAVTHLARPTPLPADLAEALARALRTVLHNVRNHAEAQHVTIHAEESAERWEVSVRDDGRGFDIHATPWGFGLREQVIAALARVGGRAEIWSLPGEGTSVVFTGDRSAATPD